MTSVQQSELGPAINKNKAKKKKVTGFTPVYTIQ